MIYTPWHTLLLIGFLGVSSLGLAVSLLGLPYWRGLAVYILLGIGIVLLAGAVRA
jgi:hypothetical protein